MADRAGRGRWVWLGLAVLAAAVALWCSGRTSGATDVDAVPVASAPITATPADPLATGRVATKPRRDAPGRNALAQTAVLGGAVRDAAGVPIPGADVCAFASATATGEVAPTCTRTASDGRYQLAVAARVIVLSATAVGFLPSHAPAGHRARRLALGSGEQRTGVDFVLARGGAALVGIVSDVFGGPIDGAFVVATRPEGSTDLESIDPRAMPVRATTDAEGRFSLWVPSGDWLIRASADGYARAMTATVVPGPTIELALRPEARLAGIVVDRATGAPVPGARIVLRAWHSGLAVDRSVGVADDAGRFRIGGLGPGRYRPGAVDHERTGSAERSYAVDLGESIDDVRIELVDAASLAATILVAPDQAPCPGGHVVLADAARDESHRADIGEAGIAWFEGVLPGSYEVSVQCDDHASSGIPKQLLVEPGANEVTWHVDGGHELRGRVLDHLGEPAAATVAVLAADGGGDGVYRPVPTDTDGRFSVAGVPDGPHTVSARLDGGVQTSTVVDVGPSTPEIELRLGPTTALRGTIRRGTDGAAGLEVRAVPQDGAGWYFGVANTADDGGYEIDGLRPGRHEVTVVDPTETTVARRTIDVRDGGSKLDLVVPEAAALVGVVLDDGVPVPDVAVAAIDASTLGHADARIGALREISGTKSVLTDAEGHFTIPGVDAAANYTVLAQRRGGGQASADGVRPGKSVTLRMQALGEVTGEVTGGVVVGLTVALRRTDGAPALRDSFPLGDGSFAFDGVPPGSYDAVAVAREGRGRARVEVASGRRSRVAITLEPNRTFRGRFVDARTAAPIGQVYAIFGEADATETELAMKAERSIATRAPGIVSDASGLFTVPDVPSQTARLFVFSADIGAGRPSIVEFVTIAPGIESPTPIDVPLVRGGSLGQPGAAVGVSIDLGTFCSDTPRISAIVDRARAPGVAVGDEIHAIDGIDTTDLRCYLARGLLSVAPGTRVELSLGGERTATLVAADGG